MFNILSSFRRLSPLSPPLTTFSKFNCLFSRNFGSSSNLTIKDLKLLQEIVKEHRISGSAAELNWPGIASQHFPNIDPLELMFYSEYSVPSSRVSSSSAIPAVPMQSAQEPLSKVRKHNIPPFSEAEQNILHDCFFGSRLPRDIDYLSVCQQMQFKYTAKYLEHYFRSNFPRVQWRPHDDELLLQLLYDYEDSATITDVLKRPSNRWRSRLYRLLAPSTPTHKFHKAREAVSGQYRIFGGNSLEDISYALTLPVTNLRYALFFSKELRIDSPNDQIIEFQKEKRGSPYNSWTSERLAQLMDAAESGAYTYQRHSGVKMDWRAIGTLMDLPPRTCYLKWVDFKRSRLRYGLFSLEEDIKLIDGLLKYGRSWSMYNLLLPKREPRLLRRRILHLFLLKFSNQYWNKSVCAMDERRITTDVIWDFMTPSERNEMETALSLVKDARIRRDQKLQEKAIANKALKSASKSERRILEVSTSPLPATQ